jgi:hypothetical protein
MVVPIFNMNMKRVHEQYHCYIDTPPQTPMTQLPVGMGLPSPFFCVNMCMRNNVNTGGSCGDI